MNGRTDVRAKERRMKERESESDAPITRSRSPTSSKRSRAITDGSTLTPWPMPWITRPPMSQRMVGAHEETAAPATYAIIETSSTGRLPYLSESDPMNDDAKAFMTQFSCSVSVAIGSEQSRSRRIFGMFGRYASVENGPIMSTESKIAQRYHFILAGGAAAASDCSPGLLCVGTVMVKSGQKSGAGG